MKAVSKIAIGAVGLAAFAGASAPAAAQYYPGYGYGYGQYGYSPNVIGQVLQSILNPYGQFGYGGYGRIHPQTAVNQCTAAVQQRLAYQNRGYGGYGYGGYGTYGGYGGYNNARILGITRVEQRSPTTLRVRGYASSGMSYGSPYGGYGGYGGAYGGYGGAYGGYGQQVVADLTFKCDVDYRGYVRDVDIDRRR